MRNLFSAIYTKFTELTGGNHNAFYTTISGKLYLGIAPQNSAYPYVVYSLVSDVYSWNFSLNGEFETVLLQFSIYSESASPLEAENIYTDLIALFDWVNINITGYNNLYMRREHSNLLWDESTFTAQRSNKIFVKNVDYRLMMEKYTSLPTVTAFTIPATASSLTISISSFTATDAIGVIGYLVNESATTPSITDANWSSTAQTTYVFTTVGSKTLYAWAKNVGNNISTSLNDSVVITIP